MLKNGYSWHAGSGNSSFWFSNWSPHDILGNQVPFVDIHDLHLSVKDVLINNGQHTQALYTNLPPAIGDTINNTHLSFNASIEDAFIWPHNKNGIYSTKSGYSWLLCLSNPIVDNDDIISWSWIWRLKVPEKYKFLIWLACHNAVPTLSLLNHRNIANSVVCSRCGEQDESFLHCVRDCKFSKLSGTKLASLALASSQSFMRMTGSKREQTALAPLCSLLDCGGRGRIET